MTLWLRRDGVPITELSREQFLSIARAPDVQGIGVILRQCWTPLGDVRPDDGLCWLALPEVRSPGNLGTLIRTAEAAGAAGLILLGDAVDPYDPSVVRASMGAMFHQKFVRTTPELFHRWTIRHDARVVGTSPHVETDYDALAYAPGTVLMLGGERQGLSEASLALCHVTVRIPMVGRVDSLNLGVAGSLLLYELYRQRRNSGGAGSMPVPLESRSVAVPASR